MITNLYQSMQPFMAAQRRRGPRPASSWMDALLCYLIWARAPEKDFEQLADALGLTSSRLQDNIARVRPVLHGALLQRWCAPAPRPEPLVGTRFPEIALLVACHTTQAFRPKAPFEEAKIYWDGKNHIYGLKSEVAVMAHAPHYCVSVADHVVASMHDYEYHKRIYELYLPYLLKTPAEHHVLPNDVQHRYWAVAADKGYIGPAHDTPDERRITPKKGNLTQEKRERNVAINRIRVVVEQYLGRVLSSWGLVHGVYRWDHAHFNYDFRICALLTNELIQHNNLNELDAQFYVKYVTLRRNKAEARANKRKAQLIRYAAEKRALRVAEAELANM